MEPVRLKKPWQPDIRVVGDERTPVVVIDEPVLDPLPLIHYASEQAEFESDSRFAYPGIRTSLPPAYADALLPCLVEQVRTVYGTPPTDQCQLIHQLFSLITRRPDELHPLQRIPHFDNHSPWYFATVHYLNPGPHAGTGFFRHRPTRFERIPEERHSEYLRAADSHVSAHGLPAEKYIDASDDHFELIAEIDYRPNRLIMYPGNLLHSGLIQPERDISDDPATGRLTANLFLYFPERLDARSR